MPFNAPLKIVIYSDGSVLEFTGFSKSVFSYKYTFVPQVRSVNTGKLMPVSTKLGTTVTFTEEHLKHFLRNIELCKNWYKGEHKPEAATHAPEPEPEKKMVYHFEPKVDEPEPEPLQVAPPPPKPVPVKAKPKKAEAPKQNTLF
jgi:hypothetical protein